MKTSIIRSCLAGFMLVLFAYSITPKRLLHNLVATHKDVKVSSGILHTNLPQLDKAGFNCQCDNLVVQLPYIHSFPVFEITPPAGYTVLKVETGYYYHGTFISSARLRGPPAC